MRPASQAERLARTGERCAACDAAGQAKKSARGMPWHQEPKKDVTSCDKLRGGANNRRSGDFRMGKPGRAILCQRALNQIGVRGEPPEREAFYRDMDVIAEELRKFQEADVPVLWRPFHEAYGDWFWWGAKGPVVASKLYCMMFEYYTNVLHLDNLLWVWNCPIREAYPGDAYVDIVSVDIYLEKYEKTDYYKEYKNLVNQTSSNKVAALAEIGYLPDIALVEQSHVPWAYYMTWSKEFCIGEKYNSKINLSNIYKSDYALKSKQS